MYFFCIFGKVKGLKLYTLSLVIVIMMPFVLNAICTIGEIDNFFELVEEKESEKKESEEKKGKEEGEDSEEYMLAKIRIYSILSTRDFEYFVNHKDFASIDKDVLLEPPKTI